MSRCGFAVLAVLEQLGQIGRPRQAAGVGRQKAGHAAQHTDSRRAAVRGSPVEDIPYLRHADEPLPRPARVF